jgi:hypothetical protein
VPPTLFLKELENMVEIEDQKAENAFIHLCCAFFAR